jgi:hypothetical protein
MANERFIIPSGVHWNEVREAPREVGHALQTAFRSIEAANPQKLQGIFGDASWTNKERLPDRTLKNLQQSGWVDALLTPANWRGFVQDRIAPLSWPLVVEDVGSFVIDSEDKNDFVKNGC